MTEPVAALEREWRRRVEEALGGRPFESLITTTFEGLAIAPLYPRPTPEGARALRQKPGPWAISQRMDHPDPMTANAMARADLDGGANALTLALAPAPAARGFGVAIEGTRSLDAALAGIDLDRMALRLDAGAGALEAAIFLALLAQDRRLTSALLDIDAGHDPIGVFARSGLWADPSEGSLREAHALLRGAGFAGRLLLADGRPYHEAGAGEAQELACVIAAGTAYLRILEAEGLSLEEARGEIAFLLAASADVDLTLAKFRALRRLWARIEEACGLAPSAARLHAETSFRMMTRTDPWMNILRAAMGVFAAGAGGADSVTVLPFTLALGLPDEAARRLARNTQLILIEEAHLAKVADPAAGSGSFEGLTQALCEEAWRLFQSIEAQGGMIAALRAGLPQHEIARTAEARRGAIARRTLLITGTSAFPDLAEAPVAVLIPSPENPRQDPEQDDGSTPGLAIGLALPCRRDAEPYEVLRAASDAHLRQTGTRPKIFLANMGAPPGFTAASTFAANVFALAGIETIGAEGFESPEAAARSFRASGCKIACICLSSALSAPILTITAMRLRDAGAAQIYLAEPDPEGSPKALLEIDLHDFVCHHRDALAILQKAAASAA